MAVPPRQLNTQYPLIDSDPHFFRVLKYARPSDYALGLGTFAAGPGLYALWNHLSPVRVTSTGAKSVMRLMVGVSACAGFYRLYIRSSLRFWGWRENAREVEMDMREMVGKVKRGEKLYGESQLSEYMQGVAARNSRYSQVMMHAIPWFNLVNHDQHGVDTAKYYKQAEKELEEERIARGEA